VDFVLAEILRFYERLKLFWKEEIIHVDEALKKNRADPRDFERWNSFLSSFKKPIESWKVWFFHDAFFNPSKYRV
jgi:hypothetical protein